MYAMDIVATAESSVIEGALINELADPLRVQIFLFKLDILWEV